MKDRQSDVSGQQAHIPFISPLLHWLAMPGVVWLRHSFGYLYLRPKSVFLASCITSTILFAIAWQEPALWMPAGIPLIFAVATSFFYVVHLCLAVIAQTSNTGEHDTYSGKSYFTRVARAFGAETAERFEMHLHLWIEPAILLLAAATIKITTGRAALPTWLTVIALALSAKELRNYWSEIRKHKRKADMLSETKDDAEDLSERPEVEAPKPTRKPRQKHTRPGSDGGENSKQG